MTDFFELAKDITRAYHEKHGLPPVDDTPASPEAHAQIRQAELALYGRPVPTNPQTDLDLKAIDKQIRTAFNDNGYVRYVEEKA